MNMMKTLFVIALLLGAAFAGLSVSNYSVSQAAFKPGASGVMTLVISNPLSPTGASHRMTGVSMTAYAPPELILNAPQNLGDIEAGGSTLVSIPFKVKDTAKSSVYIVDVRLTGFSEASLTEGQQVTDKSVTLPVTVVDPPIFTITADKEVIGGIEPITISVVNSGGPASNLQFSIAGTSTVALYRTSEIYVGNINGSESLNMTLDARSAPDGPASIPITLAYDDALGNPHSDTVTLRLTVKNEVLDLRFNQLTQLITRKDGNLSLDVINNGDALSDVRLSFTNSSLRLKDKNEIKIGDLAAGQKTSISGVVYNDLAPGLNLVSAKIEWVERDIRKEQIVNIPLTIDSDADVSVYLESKPTPLVAGSEHTISVLVSNVGSYGIDNVDVGLNSSALEPLDITPRQYIGSLAKDDFSTVQFKVRAALVPGDYPISINVRYRDASGDWVSKNIVQTASINAQPANGGDITYVAAALLVLVVAALWYFRFRKKKQG